MRMQSILAVALLTISTISSADEIQFLARETGFPHLDYSAKELKHTDVTSTLEIPGFAERSAEASRWMMCVYTNMALMRNKRYWTAAYPRSGNNVVVGFPESENTDDLEKLGPDFKGDYGLKKILAIDKMLYFCTHIGYRFKYVTSAK